jgi:hypothetical protein
LTDKGLVGVVGIERFSRGGSYELLRDRDEPGCAHEDQGRPIVAKAGDFLVCGFRRGPREWDLFAVDAPVVIAKAEYAKTIWSVVKALLKRYPIRALDRCRYKEPNWSLQKFAASLEAFDDGTLEVRGMRGLGHHSFMGDGSRLRMTRATAPKEIAVKILRAMGERREDIAKLMAPPLVVARRRTSG